MPTEIETGLDQRHRSGGFEAANLDLAVDYAFGGIHAALVTVAHTTPTRRSRAISQIAELVTGTLGRAVAGVPQAPSH